MPVSLPCTCACTQGGATVGHCKEVTSSGPSRVLIRQSEMLCSFTAVAFVNHSHPRRSGKCQVHGAHVHSSLFVASPLTPSHTTHSTTVSTSHLSILITPMSTAQDSTSIPTREPLGTCVENISKFVKDWAFRRHAHVAGYQAT